MRSITRYIGTFMLFFYGAHLRAQEKQPVVFDGPYLRYDGTRVNVTYIIRDDDLLYPLSKTFDSKSQVMLHVVPQDHPEWGFTVKRRDTLTNDPVTYPLTARTLFISDIEGEFANFRKLLIAAKVIDTAYNWTYGKNALVIPGDLFDRGKDVAPELWLLYKLEDEAKAAGGSCQVILGNHDVMNLSNDHRYTDGKYFKDAWLMHEDINNLFDADTELGRWLRAKNVIERCGDVLVMHGGMSPAVLAKNWSLAQLNERCGPYYDYPRSQIPQDMQGLFGSDALFWYRGYFLAPKATMGLVDSTLARYGCKWILVGHTIVKWNIAGYYDGKVIGVDVDEHTGNTQAALLQDGKWFIVAANGNTQPLIYKPANDKIKERDIL